MTRSDEKTERNAEILRLRGEGLTAVQIAEQVGCTKNAVVGVWNRLGATVPRPVLWNDTNTQQLREMIERGMSAGQCARALGTTRNQAHGKGVRMGLRFRGGEGVAHSISSRAAGRKSAAMRRVAPPKPVPAAAMSWGAKVNTKPIPPTFLPHVEEAGTATLLELTANMCRWPIGEPQADSFRFCGREGQDGSPYCPHHHARAYRPTPPAKVFNRSLRRYVA